MSDDAKLVREHLRTWLWRGMTGCAFASRLAVVEAADDEPRAAYAVVEQAMSLVAIEAMEAAIDEHAQHGRVSIIAFPELRTPNEVARLLKRLGARPRWSLFRLDGGAAVVHSSAAAVSLRWQTKAGPPSSVMGLAPFGVMPVMRRAPYVAFVAWGGGNENEHAPRAQGAARELGLIDIPTGMDRQKHRTAMQSTSERVAELSAASKQDLELLRDVTFILPKGVVRERLGRLEKLNR